MVMVHVPEDLESGKLRIFEEDTYRAVVKDVFGKLSKSSQQPMVYLVWIIKSEYSGRKKKDYQSTIGERVLDPYSCQEQALWRLNDVYIELTGTRLPAGGMELDDFAEALKVNLVGMEAMIDLTVGETNTGDSRMNVEQVMGVGQGEAAKPSKKGKEEEEEIPS